MIRQTLFVYGSLMSSTVIQIVIGRVPPSYSATLTGFACYYVQGATYPGITAERNKRTSGLILRELTGSEVACLDDYEDTFYCRMPITVETSDGSETTMAYVVPIECRHLLSPRAWSWQEFEQLHLQDYIVRLRGCGT